MPQQRELSSDVLKSLKELFDSGHDFVDILVGRLDLFGRQFESLDQPYEVAKEAVTHGFSSRMLRTPTRNVP
jgi:hypothetical protein